jgi:hypothetical protein
MRISIFTFVSLILITTLSLHSCQQETYDGPLPEVVDFNFHIRPILSNNCFLCHGPDPSSREANLRLDLEEAATTALENGNRPIHPGNWKKSEIMHRIMTDDPELQMPPPNMNKKFSKREIALLQKWIDQGAEWKEYWAFIPPKSPEGNEFEQQENPTKKIDYLVDKSLQLNQLPISEKANKSALVRRLSYLLTGLPPKPELLKRFNENTAATAYEDLVDELLASSHYGERWARHWMDLVRYAEYKGHEFDYPILGAWQYRDYLIRAFNEDVPYDQLITEHLAGDLMENPRVHPEKGTNESVHGTQFFTFGEGKHSPVSIRQEEADYTDNMIDVTTKTFQGLTVACSRCHDHKFDAIPTTDYYALYGIFESTRFALLPSNTSLASTATVDSIEQIKQKIKALIADRNPIEASISQKAPSNQQDAAYQKVLTNAPLSDKADLITDFRNGSLNGWFSNGMAFNNKNALGSPVFDKKGKFLRLSSAKASSRQLGTGIQGALRSPTFTIDKDKLLIRAAGDTAMIRIIVDNFQLIQDPIYGGLEKKVTNGEMRDYLFDLTMVKGRKAYIEMQPGMSIAKGWKKHFFTFPENGWIEAEYAIAFEGEKPSAPPVPSDFSAENEAKAIQNWLSGKANPKEVALINEYIDKNRHKIPAKALADLNQQQQLLATNLRDSTFFQGVTEGDLQETPVFIRGSISMPSKEKVPHRFLEALQDYSPTFPKKGSGRKELAAAIANPKNPITARLMVNRIWHHLFGRGIVETVDNFGLQGKIPTHPELLDYLALQFIEEGWSIKKLIKNIVLTEAFQRSTTPIPAAVEKDPQNLYLSHFPVRRLEGEAIRDGILAVSGTLSDQVYGEPFEIYLTQFIKGRGRPSKSGVLDGEGRRSIYQTIRRNFLPTFMLTFDMPAPFSTFGKRNVSNVPAQSLAMMNNDLVQQEAKLCAERLLTKAASFEERIGNIYITAFSRTPTEKEIEDAKNFFTEQAAIYKIKEQDKLEDVQLWADYCHSIFMMKEFIFLL